jgi:hypothetical protein
LSFLTENGFSLDVHREDVRDALFSLDWKNISDQLDASDRDAVYGALDQYILDRSATASDADWRFWIRMSRAAGRVLAVTDPVLAQGLLNAKRQGKFQNLGKEDSDYLLSCYARRYGEILECSRAADRQLILPILLEFSAIAQVLGPTEYSSAILQRWTREAQQKPRSLSGFTDEEAFNAPLRGVGSPNGTSITLYRDGGATPARVAYAGITGDRTLNAQTFSCLFSAALTADGSRSFVTSVGGVLHLEANRGPLTSSEEGPLLRGVLGPTGKPIEPVAGMPSLGMRPEDAFQIVTELFQRFKSRTGLVSVMDWALGDAEALEEKVRSALSAEAQKTCRIRNEPGHAEGGGAVHVMPLLNRNAEGVVEPVGIPVPYSILNPEAATRLTRTARQSYMTQLIANGRRREAMAKEAHKKEEKAVQDWEKLSEAQKEARIKANPIVRINQQYNFELGIIIVLDPPKEVPLGEYENKTRPNLRDQAKKYTDRFAGLCDTLDKLNRTGSIADTLTFKLLLDAAIRHDQVLIADLQFQKEYKTWMDHTSAPVWALIEDWATRRQYPIELLAADNMVFHATYDPLQKKVWIQPHVMLDLHDFEVVTDASAGTMYAFPGGRSRSLRERLIASPKHGITDPVTLHKQFQKWAEMRLEVVAARGDGGRNFRKKLCADKRLAGIILLRQGKQLLYRGEVEGAIGALERARGSDLAAAYLWGAIAHQCRFLRETHQEGVRGGKASASDRQTRLINMALNTLIGSLNPAAPKFTAANLWTQDLEVPIRKLRPGERLAEVAALAPVDHEAKMYWRQLCARDPRFVQALLKPETDFNELEAASLNVTAEEEERVDTMIHALAGLDFLALAEQMKTVARTMPFMGLPSSQLRKDLQEIAKSARSMPLFDPPGLAQVEELSGLLP